MNAVYFQNDNPGQMVSIAGRGGREIWLFNPDTGQHEPRQIPVAGGQPGGARQWLFNGTAHVDGIPGQSLQAGTAYYSYVFLPPNNTPATLPEFNFTNSGFNGVGRYEFDLNTGTAEWTDPPGNRCALVGMCYPVQDKSGPTVSSIFFGPASPTPPRILCSNQA